jgi:hypothetical protein
MGLWITRRITTGIDEVHARTRVTATCPRSYESR